MSDPRGHEREPEGDELLAAEYVLGVLDPAMRPEIAARIDRDRAFAALVEAWTARLSPLDAAYEAELPPTSVKAALDRRLFATAPGKPSLWSSLAFWRSLSAAAVAVAAFVVVAPLLSPAPPADRLVASLAADGSEIRYVVVYDPAEGDVSLNHLAGDRAEGRDFELWVIEAGKAPVSAGIIAVGGTIHIVLPPELAARIAAGAVLAISMEPKGGSPTGAPTGPVVAAGDLRSI
ncbi:MAG: anti-sigma factor [Phyllobacteriaceae bacterium]|nr:anti-sigma factor [Phyllobacteriaceae bacterium]